MRHQNGRKVELLELRYKDHKDRAAALFESIEDEMAHFGWTLKVIDGKVMILRKADNAIMFVKENR